MGKARNDDTRGELLRISSGPTGEILTDDPDDFWDGPKPDACFVAGSLFNSDGAGKARVVLVYIILIFSVLTIIPPLVYVLYYMCSRGSLKGLADQIGFHLQPVILLKKHNKGSPRYNEVACQGPGKLFLGAQPDCYGGFHGLFADNNVRTVVSLNSSKERAGNIWMRPPTDAEYSRHGVKMVKFTLPDHAPVMQGMLDKSADSIQKGLERGDVYVHCKAGQGRSAQAMLAHFVKHEKMSVDDAIRHMRLGRPNITQRTSDEIDKLSEDKRVQAQERHSMFESFIGYTPPVRKSAPVFGTC